jgi:hypothetical protein
LPADQIARSQEPDDRLVGRAVKRLPLPQFTL